MQANTVLDFFYIYIDGGVKLHLTVEVKPNSFKSKCGPRCILRAEMHQFHSPKLVSQFQLFKMKDASSIFTVDDFQGANCDAIPEYSMYG